MLFGLECRHTIPVRVSWWITAQVIDTLKIQGVEATAWIVLLQIPNYCFCDIPLLPSIEFQGFLPDSRLLLASFIEFNRNAEWCKDGDRLLLALDANPVNFLEGYIGALLAG